MVSLLPFQAGIQAKLDNYPVVCNDPRTEFISALSAQGYVIHKLIIDKIDRISGSEDRGKKKSAWYVYKEIEDSQNEGAVIGVASYGDFKLGISEHWCSRSDNQMSNKERSNYLIERERMKAEQELEAQKRHNEAAVRAYDIWNAAKPARSEAGYLKSKLVKALGLLRESFEHEESGVLLLPIARGDKILSLQFIKNDGEFIINGDPIGNKKMLYGGKKSGGYFEIEGDSSTIYIAEGYATAASIHEATGSTIYVCFDSGNIYEVASYVKSKNEYSQIIIAGDDDFNNERNVGRIKAEQAARGLEIECVFPAGFNDFNDMHNEQGIGAVKQCLKPENTEVYEQKESNDNNEVERPAGLLGEIYDYYNATSGNTQHGWAIQTALAVISVVAGRSYRSNFNNYTSLYFMCVGDTGTGKEHIKTVIEDILDAANLGFYIAGDGYTSAGAVYSTLLDRPKHLPIVDEIGRYLEASAKSNGHSMQREANTKIIEAFGRCHGTMRPLNYSTMTVKKSDADVIKNRLIQNPAITFMGTTTPCTLFDVLDIAAVKDGFINRFCISISDAVRGRRIHKERLAVPQSIIDGLQAIHGRAEQGHIATEKPNTIDMFFTEQANVTALEFEDWCIETGFDLKKYGLDGLTIRGDEIARRISMCYALSRDPNAASIDEIDMAWSAKYEKSLLQATINRLKVTISQSSFEGDKKEVLADLRERGEEGITWTNAQKNAPYSKFKKRDLEEILNALVDADLIMQEPYQPNKGGRPTRKWTALK